MIIETNSPKKPSGWGNVWDGRPVPDRFTP